MRRFYLTIATAIVLSCIVIPVGETLTQNSLSTVTITNITSPDLFLLASNTPQKSKTQLISSATSTLMIEECPELKNDIPIPEYKEKNLEELILIYLNEGGSIQALMESLNINEELVFTKDLTNDGLPEISVIKINAYIYGCINGKYHILLIIEPRVGRAKLLTTNDMNNDGLPELVYRTEYHGLSADIMAYYLIYEWNGVQFANLITRNNYSSKKVDGGSSNQEAYIFNGSETLRDIDGNGTIELLLHGGNDSGYSSCDSGPVRDETHIWMWNGLEFDLLRMELDPPKYRFQAVFDGDEASLAGEYRNAEILYQQAISDNSLFGIDHFYDDAFCGKGLGVDPKERPNLSAYSKYRIMLIHILITDNLSKTSYHSLQNEYPIGVYGHAYAELAKVFWEEYRLNQNITYACSIAINYAETNQEEILQPLGAGKYAYYGIGIQNNSYVAKNICPY